MTETVRDLPVDLIDRNEEQPRQFFEQQALAELARNIKANGLMQPITVRPKADGRFEIVAGERRWRAHQLAGLDTIRAFVREMDEDKRDVEAITENLLRKDITPMEQARAYDRMLRRGWDKEKLAEQLGLSQAWRIDEALALLKVKPEYQKLYEDGHLSTQHMRELCRLEPANQERLFRLIKAGSVKDYNHLRTLTLTLLEQEAQGSMFGDAETGKLSDEEQEKVSRLEKKVEAMAAMVAAGFDKDNGVDIARKVAPHRAVEMADKLELIARHIAILTKELRKSAAQLELAA